MAEQDSTPQEPVQSPGASLADEFYATPEPDPEPEPEQKLQEPEPDPEPEPEPEPEVKAEETEPEPDPDPGEPEVEEVEVTTLEELAAHLETDPDWIQGLTITQKVNGEDVTIKLSDALSNERMQVAGDKYLADAKSKAKAIIDESAAEKEQLAVHAAMFSSLLQEVEAAIDGDMSDEKWAQLRQQDPAEYSARKEELRERRAKYEDMKQRGLAALSQYGQQVTEQQKRAREANLPKEQERFLELVPEWHDEEVASRESQEIAEYLVAKGHTQEEIELAAYNGRLLNYVRNSMLFERSKGKQEAAKKKVVKIPKIMKPGKPTEQPKPKDGGDDPVSILYGNS